MGWVEANVMFDHALDWLLRGLVRRGELRITYPGGIVRHYGQAAPDDGSGLRAVDMTIHDQATVRALARNPDLGLAEGYMNGRITIADDDLPGLLRLAMANRAEDSLHYRLWRMVGLRRMLRFVTQRNREGRARRNASHHYDLSGELYDLFLDADRQYSCAYFERPDMTLDEAQTAKKHHIARKLALQPGMAVLDIGCGWGGMAITLARDYGATVTGITLSREQLDYGRKRVMDAGLQDRVTLELIDYRELDGRFDRIVSVGMFEHVGVPNYPTYFAAVRERLTDHGVALIHTIGTSGPPAPTSAFIRRYIFPGGALPALSEIATAVEREALTVTDIEVLRLHYARTLSMWHERFMAHADEARAIYDERFVRMWRYYLVASEMAFRVERLVVFQVQLTRGNDVLPLTRNYLMDPPRLEGPRDIAAVEPGSQADSKDKVAAYRMQHPSRRKAAGQVGAREDEPADKGHDQHDRRPVHQMRE